MPLLNVFISIIPMLLLSAAFVQLAVIPAGLPAAAVAAAAPSPSDDAPAPAVTIYIHAGDWVVEGTGFAARKFPRGQAVDAAHDPGRMQLEAALRVLAAQGDKKPEVRIVPAVRTRYEEIIDIMDMARAAGLPNAALADAVPGAV
jgi:biopolymer transport protein ExbD